ncbi:hypothetical protein [Bifidobacterium scardovii]|uniref:hypothetical protein n=1 Tax=Bifidobacterium scardovii TaxID=158787 RepID=UPI0011874A02|nr:hypothetical protein [Bifidobacterium scardovii]MDK6350059.1 hypothetical protein [Bifidobacterium scardovii]MDU8982180.1 hypothetical protein [Bifidobacterium scardovii]
MAERNRTRLGRTIRTGPKSAYLIVLWQNHREALESDWLNRYHTIWRPIRLDAWLDAPNGHKPRASLSLGKAWKLTRQILRDHTSDSYAALAGWSYTPTGEELAMWDRLELEGRLKRRGWRPWTDKRADQFGATRQQSPAERAQRMRRRHRLNQRFHISE